MKTRIRQGFAAAVLTVLLLLAGAFASFAAEYAGALDSDVSSAVSGWAVDDANPDQSVSVVLYLYTDGTTEAKELGRVTADTYRTDCSEARGNGRHAFSFPVNWDTMEGTSFLVEAYAQTADGSVRLYGSPRYSKTAAGKEKVSGPGQAPAGDAAVAAGTRGAYLGSFTTSAYCTCKLCCASGFGLTYAGTVPQANHTISADINLFPLGTRLMIGDTVYTVEDIGTGIHGNRLDIYFGSHQEALDYGVRTVDVYAVE